MAKTTIEWTACLGADGIWYPGFTFNPWKICTKISPGCEKCYASAMAKRFGWGKWGKNQPRFRTSEAYWKQPILWNEKAIEFERPYKVFCASISDWLDDDNVPIEWLQELLLLIKATPDLTWLLLSKRVGKWRERLNSAALNNVLDNPLRDEELWPAREMARKWIEDGTYPENVWMGTSVENQKYADIRIPELVKIPARARFLSCEPLLEEVNIFGENGALGKAEKAELLNDVHFNRDNPFHLHWIICGGESGQGRRKFDLDWGRSLRDQCAGAGVPFFFKQVDKVRPIPADLLIRQFPDGTEIPA